MKKTVIADISLLFVAFVWGVTFVIVQNAIQFIPPHLFNGIRFLIATLCLITFLRRDNRIFTKRLIVSGVFLGFFLFLGYAFQTVGLLYTTSSKAGFITGLSVMAVPLLAMVILKERPRPIIFLSCLLGTTGLYLLTLGDMSNMNIGDLFVLLCAVAFALQIIFTDLFSKHFQALPLTIIQLFTVSILSFASSWLFEEIEAINYLIILNPNILFAFMITSIFATAAAFYIQTTYQRYTSATKVALIFTMEPVFAAITAYLFNEERLVFSGVIGCLFIFIAMIITELPIRRKEI
ncbi:DMT family transporter [Metabacillus malikii]|uniref:Drug/metabolite transporter (DMT)-like permease n=1 Tax=Metabacillus malikii TaxID=1504265 RepID=A0ABT9ZC33_9BACI|nr:DMT family transporter [Metabacillus malikii]MDQ0228830.1 drug/metabolite transporter (DMT)-like permease [Metabacillus malikii]